MLRAMQESSIPARGVAVLDMNISDPELEELHSLGIRGVRFNLVDVKNPKSALPLADISRFAERIKPLRWHVEFLIHVDDYPDIHAMLIHFPTDIVIGHYGYFRPGLSIEHPGFQGLLELAESGKCWVKLTGPYRISTEDLPYGDVDPFGHTLVARASHRLLWGTDWPHVMMKKSMPDDGHLADVVARYINDESLRQMVLVDNPARLYGF